MRGSSDFAVPTEGAENVEVSDDYIDLGCTQLPRTIVNRRTTSERSRAKRIEGIVALYRTWQHESER
jgi:hypothetical protein